MKYRYSAEIRRGWLMRHLIGWFDTFDDAHRAIKIFKKENPEYLGPDDFYQVNTFKS